MDLSKKKKEWLNEWNEEKQVKQKIFASWRGEDAIVVLYYNPYLMVWECDEGNALEGYMIKKFLELMNKS